MEKSDRAGITEGYPRLRRRFGKLTAYIQLCRVFTGVAPLAAGLLGVLIPVQSITFEHMKTAIYVGITLMLLQFCGQCLNQYADEKLDKLAKSYRPLPSGLISREEALGISWLLAIFAVGRGFTISTFFGLITLLLLFFSVFYSLCPFSPRKVNSFLNTGWMAFSRGFLPVFAVLSVYGNVDEAWPYAVLALIWAFSFQPFKDASDSSCDKLFGIKTLFTSFSETVAMKIIRASSAIIIAYIVALAYYNRAYLGFLLLVPFIIIADTMGLRTGKPFENNLGWICFYLGLSSIYVIAFIINHI